MMAYLDLFKVGLFSYVVFPQLWEWVIKKAKIPLYFTGDISGGCYRSTEDTFLDVSQK